MSTRARIHITNPDTKQSISLYRHSDGYPEVTGYDLKQFCEDAFQPKEQTGFPYDISLEVLELATKLVKRPEYVLEGYGMDDLDNGADDIEWIYDIEIHDQKKPVLRVYKNIEHLHGFKRGEEVNLADFNKFKDDGVKEPMIVKKAKTTTTTEVLTAREVTIRGFGLRSRLGL